MKVSSNEPARSQLTVAAQSIAKQAVKYPTPDLRADTRRNCYVLAEDYSCPLPSLSCRLVVKKGQPTDGASIPRIFWSVIGNPYEPDYSAAAFVHDCLYCSQLLQRRQADKVFYKILLSTTEKHKAKILYLAVRCFGWIAWQNKSAKSVEKAREKIMITTLPAAHVAKRMEDDSRMVSTSPACAAGNSNAETKRIIPCD